MYSKCKHRKNNFVFMAENLKRNLDHSDNISDFYRQSIKTFSNFFWADIQDWKGKDIVFIISTGRTGTQWLAEFFNNSFQNLLALHEPDPSFLNLGKDFLTNNISFDSAKKRYLIGREHVLYGLEKNNNNIYIESNNRLFSMIPLIKELFPDSKIIHVVRDCRDFILSLHKKNYSKNGFSGLPFNATDFPDDRYHDSWYQLTVNEKIAWYWNMVNETIIDNTQKDNDVLRIKFEDIFNKNKEYKGLERIINFCGVAPNSFSLDKHNDSLMNKKNASSNYLLPPWEEWDRDLKENVLKISGDLMEYFGYI